MANLEQPGSSQLCQNSFIDQTARFQIENLLKIFKSFISSNAQVYKFQGRLDDKELGRVKQICDFTGLCCEVIGKENNYWIIYAYKNEGEVLNQEVVSRKRKNCEEPESEPSQGKKSILDVLIRIWVSQVLDKVLASGDGVYSFENKLSSEERREMFEFCQNMGFIYTLTWHGTKQIVSICKKNKDVDINALLESLPYDAVSKCSDQVDMPKKFDKKEELVPPHHHNFIAIEPECKWLQFDLILRNLVSSKYEAVYKFDDGLSLTERELMHQLSQEMGLSCTFYGCADTCKAFVYKTKKDVDTTMVLESLPHVTFCEETNQNKKVSKLPHHQNSAHELTRIQISQTLGNVLASKDKVDTFEAKLSPEECVAVHDLSQEMRFGVGNSRSGIEHLKKIKVGTITELKNLPRFTFSEKSKQLLDGLLTRYPPGSEDSQDVSRTNSYSTDIAEPMEDNIFRRPEMSKADITKKLEDRDARMNTPVLKQITYKRSMLPIASFNDVITSTIESHQVVIICGDTGCGKSTQVPQYILDHMWGKGEVCKIVCTQPRRISATTVSERISQERGEAIGNTVGYKTLLSRRGGRKSSIVFCTTRVLLKLLVSNGSWWLKTWFTKDDISSITHIIMDEIQERDQYSDLLLAIFREKLPSNPHLRLILMSATGDSAKFSQYFGDCPVIHVPGFTYQVKTYYLEDVVSIVKSGKYSNGDICHELSEELKLSLDKALSLAWFNDEWFPLLELVRSKGSTEVFNYQHSLTGLNPLMVFAGKGRVSDMCTLLSVGANCHLRSQDGTTALEIAEKENHHVAAALLKEYMGNDFSEKGQNLLDKYFATVNPTLVDVFLIEQLITKICNYSKDGGILVFLPGLDEINITHERLLESPFLSNTAKFMVISLHSMAPDIVLKEVFMSPPPGCRKIVLSTNIAETFTIDDIAYVIDTGRVKENIYCYNDVSTVQSSWVSKPSAKRREGCAGHCQNAFCYHLYSKAQAVSLPDFQLPEIQKMPLDELCLLVKLIDPSRKVDEFLNRMIEPPDFESVQNAIVVLQRIGALSLDGKLTQLGEKLGSLPVHPSASRMLLFSILMNCLDPALTAACASEFEDPFIVPIFPDEKKRAAVAKSELASLYGASCDNFAVIAAFECWRNSMKMGLEEQFCSKYFVRKSFMHLLFDMREELVTELLQNGLIHGNVQIYSSNAHDRGILCAVLAVGMYPKVGKVYLPNGSGKFVVKTERCDKVHLDRCSTKLQLLSQIISGFSFVVHDGIIRDDPGNMRIRKCTTVGLLSLLLNCTEIAVASAKDCEPGDVVKVIMDEWLDFESTALDISHLNYLRGQLFAAVLYKVQHSCGVLPPTLRIAMDMLACILSCDGHTSDSFNNKGPELVVLKNKVMRLNKVIEVRWTRPAKGWIKANVDASIIKLSKFSIATCGGVFRDANGSWLFGFAHKLGKDFFGISVKKDRFTIGMAELHGVLTALELAMEKGISQLHIDCDSLDSVRCLINYKKVLLMLDCDSPKFHIIRSIVQLMSQNMRVRLSHTYREGNRVADCLAKYAYKKCGNGLTVFKVPPKECTTLLTQDAAGCQIKRESKIERACKIRRAACKIKRACKRKRACKIKALIEDEIIASQ